MIEDHITAGLAVGRILGIELRLHRTDCEACMDLWVNDRAVSLAGAAKLESQLGTWLVVENPPIRRGLNGLQTPNPWPTLHFWGMIAPRSAVTHGANR